MGVDLKTWCEVVKAHPLKFKFEGLDDYHTDVREACVCDEDFMNRYMEDEYEYIEKNLVEEYLEPYIDRLIDKVDLRTCKEPLLRLCRDPQYSTAELKILEEAVGDHRQEFAYEYPDVQIAWETIREDDPSYYLEKHPPEMVWNEAYGQGFPVENVVYICPSCGRHAMTLDELEDNGWRHYCSLCGSDYLEPHDFRRPEDLEKFLNDLEVQAWPFRLMHNLDAGDLVYRMDPQDPERSVYSIVSAVDNEQQMTLLACGTKAKTCELLPLKLFPEVSNG